MATHVFEPETYYSTLGSHPPVLEIDPGDTISTTTVDAGGGDRNGEFCGVSGNPQTGPFAVRGAEPGDTLVVKIDRLWPNRPNGFTRAQIAPNVTDYGYEPTFDDTVERAWWSLDLEAGVARLSTPRNRLSGIELPLKPMLGCFGVAPERGQAISTATSGPNGGNMDYRGFVEGVTVYFPVFAEGALFHLGDGHAIQGDGEIVGTGIETSMDVTFTLDLMRGDPINWPRAENDKYIMAVGNVRPLDQAVQHATTELIQWLCGGYGLTEREAHLLLGQCIRYDVGNVYDPAYTMVAKVEKSLLAQFN